MNIPPSLVLGCSSLSADKQYPRHLLSCVVDELRREYPLLVLGAERDRPYYGDVLQREGVCDLVGKTTMLDVCYLLTRSTRLVVAVDSSILHASGYFDLPIVALFGRSDYVRFGPFSRVARVVSNRPRGQHQAVHPPEEEAKRLMEIPPEKVLAAIREVLEESAEDGKKYAR